MTAVGADVATLEISLEQGDSPLPECWSLPNREYRGTFYENPRDPLSIAVLPTSGEAYEFAISRVARQNARVAERAGYLHEIIDRAEWEDDLHELRSSAVERQGRRMPNAYLERQSYSSDRWPEPHCRRHLVTVHGIVSEADRRLRAYAQVVQCGEIVRFNTILGHAALLEQRVVWALVLRLIQWHIDECGARFALYYTHDSGHGGGLRYFKERLGFRPARAVWRFR